MMFNVRQWTNAIPYAAILLAFLALLNRTYPEVYHHPGEHIFADAGDGAKNYYTFLYHARHDTAMLDFSGMHYPYGEHVVYADAQPLFSNSYAALDQLWPGGIGDPVIWLNLALMLAFPLAGFFMYRLLRRLDVPVLLATVGAVVVIWMCPQVTRLPFYLGLAYPFVLPLGLLLYLRYRESVRPWRWTLVLVGYVLLAGLVHPYWILQLAVMYGALGLVHTMITPGPRLMRLLPTLTQALLPLLVFTLFMGATDQHEGRNPDPGGFYEFTSIPETVFLPVDLEETWYGKVFSRSQEDFYQHWEGRAYIGWLGNVAWLAWIVLGLLAWRGRWRLQLPPGALEMIWGSLLVLLLAMGIPFQVPGLEFLAEAFPAVKQFRAMGRLALLFYFGSGILGMVLLGKLVRWPQHALGQVLAWGLALGACYLTLQEGDALHAENRRISPPQTNWFSEAVLQEDSTARDLAQALQAIDPSQYQAIVPLPFYHIGTEALSPETSVPRHIIRESLVLSWHTGLPLTAAYLARTSLSETREAFTFFTPNYWEKSLPERFPSQKDFLLVCSRKVGMDASQQRIRKLGKLLFENRSLELRTLPLAAIWDNPSEALFQLMESPNQGGLHPVQQFYCTRPETELVFKDFEDRPSRTAFRGQGAWEAPMAQTSVLYEFKAAPFPWTAGRKYRISFWYNHAEDRTQMDFFIGARDASGSYAPVFERSDPFRGFVTEGHWTLVKWDFVAPEKVAELALVFRGKYGRHRIQVDDLLILPADAHIYQPLDSAQGKLTRLYMDNMVFDRGN